MWSLPSLLWPQSSPSSSTSSLPSLLVSTSTFMVSIYFYMVLLMADRGRLGDQCRFQARTKVHSGEHTQRRHGGHHPDKCGICSWTYDLVNDLNMHLVQHFEKIVLPAYTSFGHGQNFVQKGWDNGKFSHGPDEERIGSIIFLKGGLKSHSIYYLF